MGRAAAIKDHALERRLVHQRLWVALLVLAGATGLLLWRLLDLQVGQHDQLRALSDRNRVHLRPVAPTRGLIFDRDGRLLARNEPGFSLTLVRESIPDIDATLALLTRLIDIGDEEIEQFHQQSKRQRNFEPVPLRARLSEKEIAILAANRPQLPGVEVQAKLQRDYPEGPLVAHVLGYVGRISEAEINELDRVNYLATNTIGKVGVERQYESILHGEVGYEQVETDVRGRVISVLERTDPIPGHDLNLTLDLAVQRAATEALGDWRGAVVALDVHSGALIALVSAPAFDANWFVGGISRTRYASLRDDPNLPLFNRALRGRYPPGSTVKPFLGLAGLASGAVTPATRMNDPGWYQLPNQERVYRDWKRGGHGRSVDLRQAIVESCDTYYYELAVRLGIDRIAPFLADFGFGRRTGIDLPGERAGILPSREWKRTQLGAPWYPGETVIVGIGQGYTTVTPLQLAAATAMLANGGRPVQPHVVRPTALTETHPTEVAAVDAAAWDYVQAAMEAVVHDPKGTARLISTGAPYRIAGKTGTAQVVSIAADAEYDSAALAEHQRDHALFIAYAPVESPRIAVAVVVENGEHGSSVAAPIARATLDAFLIDPPP